MGSSSYVLSKLKKQIPKPIFYHFKTNIMKPLFVLFLSILVVIAGVMTPVMAQNQSNYKLKKAIASPTEGVKEDYENAFKITVNELTQNNIDRTPLRPDNMSYLDKFKHTIHSKILWRLKTGPNPVNQVLKVNLQSESDAIWEVNLIAPSGQSFYFNTIKNNETQLIDVQKLASGLYFLVVKNGTDKQVEKIMVQN
jgi:hypothetical protein